MKFKEKIKLEHSTIYVPEHFESKSMVEPSSNFMNAIKEIKSLDFIQSSTMEFVNLCKLSTYKS